MPVKSLEFLSKPPEEPAPPGDDYARRFGGIARLYGAEAAGRIRQMHVCVVGLGGVGSWAAEALARTGIGALTLIDFDTVCPTNVNRQIHAHDGSFERKKLEVMAERIQAIHPECAVTAVDDYLTTRNLQAYLAPERGHTCVLDAIDSIAFKAAMIAHCRRRRIPIVTTGGAGGLTDPTRIQVKDLSRTWNDPLAAKVRAHLRAHHGFSRNPKRAFGVACVFSTEQPRYPRPDGTVGFEKPGVCGVSLDCRLGYGAVSFVTASFGLVAAARVVEKGLRRMERQAARGG